LWRAVAQTVPVNGKFVANPYTRWSDIDSSLPSTEITVYGPAHNHGTRDAWVELVMDPGCHANAEVKALPADEQKKICDPVREDGRWIEISGDYAVTMERVVKTPGATAVITYSYLDQNSNRLQGATVDDIEPSFEAIASGKYPLARSLFFYIKREHVPLIPGLKDFITEFVSTAAVGRDGYLAEKGLIPLPADKLANVQATAAALPKLTSLDEKHDAK
jgi:phosphate transport system substrate-binding protein